MKTLFIFLALFTGQLISMQKSVVHLAPHRDSIDIGFDGKLLELDHGPPVVHLPDTPPKPDGQGKQWSIDVKNFGPAPVTVADKARFSAAVNAGQTIHIRSNGTTYLLEH